MGSQITLLCSCDAYIPSDGLPSIKSYRQPHHRQVAAVTEKDDRRKHNTNLTGNLRMCCSPISVERHTTSQRSRRSYCLLPHGFHSSSPISSQAWLGKDKDTGISGCSDGHIFNFDYFIYHRGSFQDMEPRNCYELLNY